MPTEQKPGQSAQSDRASQAAGEKAEPSQAGSKPASQSAQDRKTREKSASELPLSKPLGEAFAQNATLWFATQAELLANVDALTHAWLSRRREGVDAMREAIQQMTDCKDPAEMLHIQQDWLSGAFRRASEDIAALNDGIASMTQKASSEFEKAARKVIAPLYTVSEEMRQAAGNKPQEGSSLH